MRGSLVSPAVPCPQAAVDWTPATAGKPQRCPWAEQSLQAPSPAVVVGAQAPWAQPTPHVQPQTAAGAGWSAMRPVAWRGLQSAGVHAALEACRRAAAAKPSAATQAWQRAAPCHGRRWQLTGAAPAGGGGGGHASCVTAAAWTTTALTSAPHRTSALHRGRRQTQAAQRHRRRHEPPWPRAGSAAQLLAPPGTAVRSRRGWWAVAGGLVHAPPSTDCHFASAAARWSHRPAETAMQWQRVCPGFPTLRRLPGLVVGRSHRRTKGKCWVQLHRWARCAGCCCRHCAVVTRWQILHAAAVHAAAAAHAVAARVLAVHVVHALAAHAVAARAVVAAARVVVVHALAARVVVVARAPAVLAASARVPVAPAALAAVRVLAAPAAVAAHALAALAVPRPRPPVPCVRVAFVDDEQLSERHNTKGVSNQHQEGSWHARHGHTEPHTHTHTHTQETHTHKKHTHTHTHTHTLYSTQLQPRKRTDSLASSSPLLASRSRARRACSSFFRLFSRYSRLATSAADSSTGAGVSASAGGERMG